jgi:tRNA threonylcarbamoyladenosine biosynthesis protein TsaB
MPTLVEVFSMKARLESVLLNTCCAVENDFVGEITVNSKPLILAIDTATRAGSVALARGAELLHLQAGAEESSHSIDLIENVEVALNTIGAKLSEVELFTAASGPGSFTGLRIGIATIKSFAVSVGKQCVGVPTLAAVAHAAGTSVRTVALLPAGRGEVFAQMFSVDANQVRPLDTAAHISPEAVVEKYGSSEGLIWAGEGAHLNATTLCDRAKAGGIGWYVRNSHSLSRSTGWMLASRRDELAGSIAGLAFAEYCAGRTTSPGELRAIYVRPSDAEINEQWQSEKSQLSAPG